MTLKNTLSIKDMVIAVTDMEGLPRIITGILVKPSGLLYECTSVNLQTGIKQVEYFMDAELEKIEMLNIIDEDKEEGEE